ncbi:hypothetical protein B0O80DRAFT_434299 [Mortierella sp. GBAus27b]|nr:hypothetical protein BGX31_009926 [Mortierella sp. GBA43]KAI8363697.1 hypothetical protein B0O80DRAFT_434299 [Mortierella sp. GBAus27b]
MRPRFNVLSAASLAAFVGLISVAPKPAQADITCTQFGWDLFKIGSVVKFQWNDTESVSIDTFNLDLYCHQTGKLIQTITSLTHNSSATVSWTVNSTLASFTSECTYNQFQGAFSWPISDPDTGAQTRGVNKCKIMLLTGPGAYVASPGAGGNAPEVDQSIDEDPDPSDIVVSEKTKHVVIGVGCAFGALVLAGFIGFYYIRHKNKRAAEKDMSKKLREPVQTGPLFPPMDRSNGSSHGLGAGGRAARYNELASVTSASLNSPAMTSKTDMAELGAMISRSPTPIAAAHTKLGGQQSQSPLFASAVVSDRPGSLLASSFVPTDGSLTRPSSPAPRNPFEQS